LVPKSPICINRFLLTRAFCPRNFTDAATSEQNNILINETLARATGWENPIGKTLNNHDFKEDNEFIPLTIVGVVKDFHILPLRDKVEPLVIHYQNHGMTYLSIRSNPGATWQVQDAAAAIWAKHFPHLPFDYFYLDQRFDAIHRQERNIGKALIYFTILAIFIASLGLYGLTSYAVDRRLKEIGIRKVLGSSSATIIIMLFRDFSRLILAAMLVAWPLAWYIMHRWLHHFAYHTSLPIWIFGLAGLLAAAIAFFTIGARSLRAARLNPVQILKCE
jgi:putative ABC transport system permease protein